MWLFYLPAANIRAGLAARFNCRTHGTARAKYKFVAIAVCAQDTPLGCESLPATGLALIDCPTPCYRAITGRGGVACQGSALCCDIVGLDLAVEIEVAGLGTA